VNNYAGGGFFLMLFGDVTLTPVFEAVIEQESLPEAEIGTYYINENGMKEYIQFQNYDLCMMYMNDDDDLCRNTSANLNN